TPQVTGVAALAWSLNPGATRQAIRDAILGGVDHLSSLTGKVATGGRLNARRTLEISSSLPSLMIGDVALTEGNSGTTDAIFTVSLSAASDQAVTVNYATANGTAATGRDYAARSRTLTIPAGSTFGTIAVPVIGDVALEPDETFFVNLSGASHAA